MSHIRQLCFRGQAPVYRQAGAVVEIPLTQGQIALVDIGDLPLVCGMRWQASWIETTRSFYARCVKGKTSARMHRVILDVTNPRVQVDHINHDTLCNLRSNLRRATNTQNSRNERPRTGGSSRFKGVSWHSLKTAWFVSICVDRKIKSLGYFKDEVRAAKAYDVAARAFFGDYAFTNEDAGLLPRRARSTARSSAV